MKLRIKQIQKSKKISNIKLAEKIGVTPQQISNYHTGVRFPAFENLQEIAKALDCEIHELFEASDEYFHDYDKLTNKWRGIKEKQNPQP